jgi:hypothetical protein
LRTSALNIDDPLSVGCGLIQIEKAFDLIRSLNHPSI